MESIYQIECSILDLANELIPLVTAENDRRCFRMDRTADKDDIVIRSNLYACATFAPCTPMPS